MVDLIKKMLIKVTKTKCEPFLDRKYFFLTMYFMKKYRFVNINFHVSEVARYLL